jgi:hypothetical protein
MFVRGHHSLHELQERAKEISRKRVWLRFQSVILAQQGVTAPDIAWALGCSRRGVQSWIAKYNEGGVSALYERPHPGRRPILVDPGILLYGRRIEDVPGPDVGVCPIRDKAEI